MLIIPVIDIKDGKCVRTVEGLSDSAEFYSESPINMAMLFRKENFKTLHITDLDGAIHGNMKNFELIKEITKAVDIPVQLGGGIRDFETAKKIIEELGVYRIVIGTAALNNPDFIKKIIDTFSSSKLVVCIDEKLNNVVTDGWINYANITPLEFAKQMETLGVKRIIYQDVTRVGNLCGPHIERLIEIAKNTKLKITSAGGICNYKDLKKLADMNFPEVDSVMISRALYENQFPCQRIWREQEIKDKSLDLPEVN
ncbi:MAG TPA: 1-(5-phosphoribosyl)-5-[(5-phosphoribosylamino)methylideneamino]imidazole-4-carboxamide isomerase [Ignavibacteria bacterium]|nr:1-(5-phosphoribosyl)-5-[(5-phosphoribosylamino)methylideneamino]imidazole-4-carboxamide isomerase [Ignavibacteria bacterium]HMR39549.1 1-(5-phosphoribosyl)-5-[(5-phosphoribosylamino)methylideneamino]imidazole-4-carboxamide isomerase [Ignavibacteria bacterium]